MNRKSALMLALLSLFFGMFATQFVTPVRAEGATTQTSPDPSTYLVDDSYFGFGTENGTYISSTHHSAGIFDPVGGVYTWQWEPWGPRIDNLHFKIKKTADAQLAAILSGDVDVLAPVTRPADVTTLEDAGFTITQNTRLGYTFFFENNIVYPISDVNMRRAINRLIDKDYIVTNIYGLLMRKAGYWLPPGSAYINSDAALPEFNPDEAIAILDAAGYVQGAEPNPSFDPSKTWSAQYLRIDPNTGGTLAPIEHVTSEASPLGYEMTVFISDTLRKAGLQINFAPKPFDVVVSTISNDILDDYQLISGIGIAWGNKWPRILYEFTYSTHTPLWNMWNFFNAEADYWGNELASSLNTTRVEEASYKLQELLRDNEPYLPMLIWNQFSALNPQLDGIINMPAIGPNNQWTFLNIHHQGAPMGGTINWCLSWEPDSLSPATSNNVYAWTVLNGIFDSLRQENPETAEFMPWLAENWNIEPWTAPGDIPGMKMTFSLRNDVYWHDGVPFTAEDVKFGLEYIKTYQLQRYVEAWLNLVEVVIPQPNVVEIRFNTSNYFLLDRVVGAAALFPKHIWQDVTDPLNFRPWEQPHSTVPGLTKLIGTGPFYFDSYVPGSHVLLKANPNYFKKAYLVGSSGGTISNPAETVSVDIPAGALTEDTVVAIDMHPTEEYGGFLVNQSDSIVSYGVSKLEPTGTTFTTPVTVTLAYNESLVDENNLQQLMVLYSADGVTWSQIPIESIDTTQNIVTIRVDHFSLVLLLRDTEPPVIQITSPEPTEYSPPGILTLYFRATDSVMVQLNQVPQVAALLDGTPVTSGQTVDLSTLSAGTHTLSVWANDNAGNEATSSVAFTVVSAYGSVSGAVIDEYTRQPIQGATVTILETGASETTDAEGKYSFINLQAGSYTVEMTVPYGYLTHDAVTKFVDVLSGQDASVEFTLYQAAWSGATVPRTIGYWKNWENHYPRSVMENLIANVKASSGLFSDLTVDNLQSYLTLTRFSTMKQRGEAQLLASWLNVVSAQLGVDVQVDITSIAGWQTVINDADGVLSVSDLLKLIDNHYLSSVALTKEQWETIKNILDALNNGQLFAT